MAGVLGLSEGCARQTLDKLRTSEAWRLLTWGDGRTYRGTRSGGTAAIDEWIAYELLLSIVPSDWERGVKETPCDALRWQ